MIKIRNILSTRTFRNIPLLKTPLLVVKRWTSSNQNDPSVGSNELQSSSNTATSSSFSSITDIKELPQQSTISDLSNLSLSSKAEIPHTPERSRGLKLPPRAQKFVILNARTSKILPPPRPTINQLPKTTIKQGQLDAQLKRLLIFKSEVPNEVILESIKQLQPSSQLVSDKRYKQLYFDILRAYTVPQLREFLKKNVPHLSCGSWRKNQLASYILDNLWKLQPSKEISESSDVIVENIISVSRRDLFMIVSTNGKLARYWTKSGAKIIILGEEQKVVIRSTEDTYKWIQISMTNALNDVKSKEFDLTPFSDTINVDNLPLDSIQRLSDAYIEKVGFKLIVSALGFKPIKQAERLIWASSGFSPRLAESFLFDSNKKNLERGVFSEILDDDSLSWLDRDKEWARWKIAKTKVAKSKPSNSQSKPNKLDHPSFSGLTELFSDYESQESKNKPDSKFLASISGVGEKIDRPELQLIQGKPFSKTPISINSSSVSLRDEIFVEGITDSIMRTFNSVEYQSPKLQQPISSHITVAATFGDILQHPPTENSIKNKSAIDLFISSTSANQEAKISFLTNVPNILNLCQTLPLFSSTLPSTLSESGLNDSLTDDTDGISDMEALDVFDLDEKHPDAGISIKKPGAVEISQNLFNDAEKSPAQILDNLFNNADNSNYNERNTTSISDEHSYYVQLKFLPSPFLPDGSSSMKQESPASKDLGESNSLIKAEQFKSFPPIEMWLEIDENEFADTSSVSLVSVLKESNTYVSLAHLNTDVKFSVAKTEFLLDPSTSLDDIDRDFEVDKNEIGDSVTTRLRRNRSSSVKSYLGQSQLNFSGLTKVNAPNILSLEMPMTNTTTGDVEIVEVPYIYQSMSYRKQIDLRFRENILQLATIEGGVVGGRRIEANLVLDRPSDEMEFLTGSKNDEENDDTLKTFVTDVLQLLKKLQVTPKNIIPPQ